MLKSIIRRLLRRACALILRLRSRPLELSAGGAVLVIAPHPDDESLGCGAVLARLCANRTAVHVACFTDSPDADISALRRGEFRRAMSLLALPESSLHFMGGPDGRLKDLSPQEKHRWSEAFRTLLDHLHPSEILLPCRTDGSSEHDAMFKLLVAALPSRNTAPRVIEFPVWSWWNPRFLRARCLGKGRVWRQSVSYKELQTKSALLRCYPSQTEPGHDGKAPMLSPEFLAAFLNREEFYFESPLPDEIFAQPHR